MAAKACVNEFQVKHFGFADAAADDFYRSQWFESRSIFVGFKAFLFVYSLIWAILVRMHYDTIYPGGIFSAYLSNWGEWVMVVYFGVSLLLAVYGLTKDLYTHGGKSEIICCTGNRCNNGDLRWFHHLTWIMFNISLGTLYLITIMYWSFLAGERGGGYSYVLDVHQHAVTTVLVIIDLFVSRVPVRLLHFIYPCGFLMVYCVVTLILYGTDVITTIYPWILDWKNNPGTSAGVCLGIGLLGTPTVQAITFGFYHLRSFISRKVFPIQNNREKNESFYVETPEEVALDTVESQKT